MKKILENIWNYIIAIAEIRAQYYRDSAQHRQWY